MISRTALYTIRALALLAPPGEGEYIGAAAIARAIGAPPNYLGKLLQSMARSGFVVSRKGIGGGFRLARAPSAISLYDVVNSIDQVERWNGCFLGRSECTDENACVMHDKWSVLRDNYMALLSQTSLADLMHSPNGGMAPLDAIGRLGTVASSASPKSRTKHEGEDHDT